MKKRITDNSAKASTKAIVLTLLIIAGLILGSLSLLMLSPEQETKNIGPVPNTPNEPEYQPLETFEDAEDFVQESDVNLLLWSEMDDQTNFTNAYYGYYGNTTLRENSYGDGDGVGDEGNTAPGLAEDAEAGGAKSSEREIEEADIVKIVDDTFYVLNTYRGLVIIDLSNPDSPSIIGRQQVYGEPVDMYIVDTKAYIVLSSFYYYGFRFMETGGGASIWNPYNWEGSQICIIDISDSTNPYIIGKIELEGQVTDTRRVGDVIYAVSTEYDYYYWGWEMDDMMIETEEGGSADNEEEYTGPQTYVVSLNFADPEDITEVDRVNFPGTSNEIHVTQEALYVAKPSYGDESSDWEPYTEVTYVDISDPAGTIYVKGTFRADGRLEDRYQMDHYDDTFRMVTHFRTGIGESKLWIFDVSDPNDISKLGELLVDDAGSLMATRFEGERAYTIHLPRSIDPLDTIDLSDPTDPLLCDVLEMPGWVEHIEVRGYKLLALGVDDSEGQRKVAVSLFDVTDPYNTELKDRVTIGEGYSWSGANFDPKALSVIDDQNLILVPFTSYSYDETNGRSYSMNGVQIVEFDLDGNDLIARGVIENAADQVLRTRTYGDRILSTSNYFLQVIDALDRDDPEITAQLELCSDIEGLTVVDDYAIQLVNTWWDEDNRYKLRCVDSDRPDSYPPISELSIGGSDQCYMYTNDELIYIFETDYNWDYYGDSSYESKVTVYDFSNPLVPEVRGSLTLPFYMGYVSQNTYAGFTPTQYYSWYYSPNELLQMNGEFFIYHPGESHYWYDYNYLEDDVKDGSNTTNEEDEGPEYNEMIYVIDLSNPDTPQVAAEFEFDANWIVGFKVRGTTLYFTDMETISNEEYGYGWTDAVYYLGRIELSDPSNPELLPYVNIPGTFVDANEDGTVIYTSSTWWETVEVEGDENKMEQVETFNILTLKNDVATLKSAIKLDGDIRSIYIEDGLAYFTLTRYEEPEREDEAGTGSGDTSGSTDPDDESVEGKTSSAEEQSTSAPEADYYYYEETIEVHSFRVYDLSKLKSPKVLYELELCDYGYIREVAGGYVLIELSWSNGLLVFDFNNPTAPAALGFYPIRGGINDIFIYEPTEIAYVVCGYYGVYMVELSAE